MEINRNSRWTRDPVLNAHKKPIIARLSDKDIALFKLLARYRYLPADYLHAFLGGSYKVLVHRLNLLCRKPNLYVNRPEQQRQNANANYRYLTYELDDRGAVVLRERGMDVPPKKYHRNFAHELMVCQIAASLDLGIRSTKEVELIPWQAILASEQFPKRTRESPHPQTIPLIVNGEPDHLTADWEPFVIRSGHQFMFFPGFEADCGTEPIDSLDRDRSSIRRKFSAYLAIMENRIYAAHFGANSFFVPIITTNESRMRSMMSLLERMKPGQNGKRFLFKHIPAFTSFGKPAPATGHMLTQPWERAGLAPFSLINPNAKEKAAA